MSLLNLSRLFPFPAVRPPPTLTTRRRLPCLNSHYTPAKCKRAYTSVMIVPTGIGASIGGFAGDALPVARALASVVDCLISHPNSWRLQSSAAA